MGSVIGDILPVALGVAISPVPIIAVILMLLAPGARATSIAFASGWVVAVIVVVSIVTALVPPSSASQDDGSIIAGLLQLLVGVAAVFLGVKQWQSRPKGDEEPRLPAWMAAIDEMTAVKAAGLGFLLAGVSPKNLALCIAGGAAIGGGGLDGVGVLIAVLVFVLIASCTVVLPVVLFLTAQEKMQKPLDDLRAWLTVNNSTVMAVLLVVLGVVILGKGIGSL